MKCPKCQFENREGAIFCGKCGAGLSLVCPKCSAENPPPNSFCDKCGHNLTLPSGPSPKEPSFDEKIAKIQKYLPKGLTDKILAQRDRIEGERKQVTVMFCDMEGYSQLSERLGPEEAYDIMDQVYEILIHKVHNYEGTVNEMTGDGIMALFGAPIALEDAPQRAIRSAMAIHREMARFSDRTKEEREGIPPLKMRVGIHTGPVVVGTLGNDLRVEFKAVGETVNLASRMEGLAEPGATFVTEDTFKLTEGFFRFEALGEKEVKGKKEPVGVYRAIATSTRRTRFDVSAERGLTPFVGREREVDLLLDAFARVKGGRGQAFSIMSEAGVGKSRLLYEFRKAVTNENVTFLEGKCLSYSGGVAYHPVIDILKSNFDVLEGEEDAVIREKVKKNLKILGLDEASTLPYFLELLSVRDSGIDKIIMSPEGKKDRIIGALKRIVLKSSEIRPLILAFEDLHWMDKSSEEVVKDLLESIPGTAVFLVFTYRPEFVHTWGTKSYHNQITLSRLSNRESLIMISHLLGTEDIESDLEELILEKTEGIPFFIEEFVRSLKDLNVIERTESRYHLSKDIQDVIIPSTIQDVIMARVDSLPEGAKEVLQTGAVIEREFSYELIKRTTGLPEQELLSHLSVLKDSELLYERGIYPQSTYIFKHALTKEVVYDSILTKTRKGLHEEIGNVIEELYKDNIEEHYGLLAEHYITGKNYDKGAEYSKLAAKKDQKAASFKNAIEHARNRVFCLEKLPRTEEVQKKIIDARTVLANYYLSLGRYYEANESVAPIVDLAIELNYQRRLPVIYTSLGTCSFWVEEKYSKGFEYLNETLKIAEKTGDLVSVWTACYHLALALSINCEFEKGYEYFKKCLDLSELAGNMIGISLTKGTISIYNYIPHGKIDLAYQMSIETLLLAEESDEIYIKTMAYSAHGTASYFRGLLDEAKESLTRAVHFSEKSVFLAWWVWAAGCLGFAYSDMGEYERAQNYYTKSISLLEATKMLPSFTNIYMLGLTRAKVLGGHQEINRKEIVSYYDDNRIKWCEGFIARYIGEILLNMDDRLMFEAEGWINKAIEADKRNGTLWNLGRNYALYAELFKRKDDKSKAKENLNKAIDILKECGANGWVKTYEEEMTSLS